MGCSTGGFKAALSPSSRRFSEIETASRFDADHVCERCFDSVYFRDQIARAFLNNDEELVIRTVDQIVQQNATMSKNTLDRMWTDAVTVLFLNRGLSLMTLGLVFVTLTEHQKNHMYGYSVTDKQSTLRSTEALKRVLVLGLGMGAQSDCVSWMICQLGKPIASSPPLNSKGRVVSSYTPLYDRVWTAIEPFLSTTSSSTDTDTENTEAKTKTHFVRQSLHLPHVWKMYLERFISPTHPKPKMYRARFEEFMVHLSTLVHTDHPHVCKHVPDVQPVLEELRRLALIVCADEWDTGDEGVRISSARRQALFTFFDYFRIRSYSRTSEYVPAWNELKHTIETSKHIPGVAVAPGAESVLYTLFRRAVKLTKGPHTNDSDVFSALRNTRSHIHTRPQGLPWLCLATLAEGKHMLHRLHILMATELVARDLITPAFRGLLLGELCRSLLDEATKLWTFESDADVRATEPDQFEFLKLCVEHRAEEPPHTPVSIVPEHPALTPSPPGRLIWGTADSIQMLRHFATATIDEVVDHLVAQPGWGMETMLLRCPYSSSPSIGDTTDEDLLRSIRPRTRVAVRIVATGILLAGKEFNTDGVSALRIWNTLKVCCTLEGCVSNYLNCLSAPFRPIEWFDIRVPRPENTSPVVRLLVWENSRTHASLPTPSETPAGKYLFTRGYKYSFWSTRQPSSTHPRPLRASMSLNSSPSSGEGSHTVPSKMVVMAGTKPPPPHTSGAIPLLFPSAQSCSISSLTKRTKQMSMHESNPSKHHLISFHDGTEIASSKGRIQWSHVPSVTTMTHDWVRERIQGWIQRMYTPQSAVDSIQSLRIDALPLSKCYEAEKYRSILGARQNMPYVLYVRAQVPLEEDLRHVLAMMRCIVSSESKSYAPICSARFCALASAHDPHTTLTDQTSVPSFYHQKSNAHSLEEIADTFVIALAWFSRIRFADVEARCASEYAPLLIKEIKFGIPGRSAADSYGPNTGSLLLPDIDIHANDPEKMKEYPLDISRTYTAWHIHLSAHYDTLWSHRERVYAILSYISNKTRLPWILAQWELVCSQRQQIAKRKKK